MIQQLPRYAAVTLVESDRGRAHVALDGTALGYVLDGKLQKLARPTTAGPALPAPIVQVPPALPRRPTPAQRVKKPPSGEDNPAIGSYWKDGLAH